MDDSSPLSELNQMKDFQCHICQKYFTRKFTLDMHLLIHDNVKPFPCPFCGKCFCQKGTLMRHKALHSINNLFHCSLCNRGFRQKNVFLYHLRHRHKVATETLDRRKYPMEDYQSIMDTLPSFVHADSTAITSSEKHLDAILFETLTNGDSAFADGSSVNNGQMLSDDCSNVGNTDDFLNGGISYKCSICFMFFVDFDEYKHHIEDQHNNEEMLLDSKPILSSVHFPLSNITELVSKSDATSRHSVANNLQIPNSNLVTSSIEENGSEKGNLCIRYQKGFIKKELKNNSLKIPVKNLNANNSKSDGSNPKTSNSTSSKVNCDTFLSKSNLNLPLKSKNKTLCNVFNKMTHSATLNKIKTKNKTLNSGSQVNLVKSFSTSSDSHSEREVISLGEEAPYNKCNSKSSYTRTLYKCKLCDEIFKKKIAFEYHRQMHLSSRAFACSFCKAKFKSKQLLLLHTRSKHMKTFKCDSCSRTFNYHSIFTFHKKNCYRANLEGCFKSRFCLPLVDLDKLFDSDVSGIAGVIPVCDDDVSKTSNIKFGIPIVSVEAMRNFSKNIFFNSLEIKALLK